MKNNLHLQPWKMSKSTAVQPPEPQPHRITGANSQRVGSHFISYNVSGGLFKSSLGALLYGKNRGNKEGMD